jgi:pyridinium-3,5-biscarboxylic acid mononucleotide synthase
MREDEQIKLDFDRAERLGFSEAVYAENKSIPQLVRILEQAAGAGQSILLTRFNQRQYEGLPLGLRQQLDYDPVSRTAFFGSVRPPSARPRVAVLSAGTSDAPVVLEVMRTLAFYGQASMLASDVGVAGLWRLLERIKEIRTFPVVIVVAGMDGALPSVVGGLVPGLVVAVPTSVGYGVAANGTAALQAALASCSPGLVVVNVDNGYGAACAALRVLGAFGNRSSYEDQSP